MVEFPKWSLNSENNHAYVPVLFESEEELLKVERKLKENNILPRRYFYPSLDTLDWLRSSQVCLISNNIASRILCLPIYPSLQAKQQLKIIQIMRLVNA